MICCRKEILYRSSDQYGCCCFICDRKQQDQAERKKYRYSDEGDHDVFSVLVDRQWVFFRQNVILRRMLFSARSGLGRC